MGFSRTDWITIGVTLVLFALTYYFSGPKVAFACLVVGAIILFVMMLVRRNRSGPTPTQSVQQTASPTITQTASPTINVNVGQGATPSPPQPLPSTPKPEPNIHFVGAQTVGAHPGLEDGYIYESPQPSLREFDVSVVCFRNESLVGRRVQEPRIKAHIVYRDRNGDEITDAPRGVWLSHNGESILFETGKKRCLIIFLLSSQDTLKRVWNESYTTRNGPIAGRRVVSLRHDGIRGEVSSVVVTLLADDVCLLRAQFTLEPHESGQLPKLVCSSLSDTTRNG